MAELVAKRYAQALFEIAEEMGKLDTFKEEINGVSQVFKDEKELMTIFEHPKLSKKEKKDIVNSIFKGRVSQEILNFLYIIIDKGRERFISDISKSYTSLSNEEQGIVEAKAITAVPMSETEKENLENRLSNNLEKNIILTNVIDESILGGVLVRIGDKVIDSSIKGRLEEIEKNLKDIRVRKG